MALSTSAASRLAAFAPSTLFSEAQNSCTHTHARSLVVRAARSQNSAQGPEVSRRQLALGLGAFGASLASWVVAGAERSWALLDDDDDAELLERVKRERKERKSKLDLLKPEEDALQTAVTDLRAVGKALDAGDLASASKAAADVAAAAAAGGPVEEITAKLNAGAGTIGSLRSGISDLQAALTAEDVLSAKKAFVASATALKDLSSESGLAAVLTGL